MVTFSGKFLKLLETHKAFFTTAWPERASANVRKEKRFGNQQPSLASGREGSETIIGITNAVIGKWYSPFFLETGSTKRSCRPPCNSERGNNLIFGTAKIRRGSSVGKSVAFITPRSWVRLPPSTHMPVFKTKNENFFKIWTPEMAYVLGFFTADGNMIKNKRGAHFISIEITDRDILEEMRKVIGSNHKITERKRNAINKVAYRLQIGSKEIFNDLLNLGITPHKSKTIDLPKIPDNFFPHFVRGYFDGDGNVISGYYRKSDREKKSHILATRFTSGSSLILVKLKEGLNRLILTTGSLRGREDAWTLNYSINDSKKLFSFMYGNIENNLYLNRKKVIFEKHFKV